eukprot:UN07514
MLLPTTSRENLAMISHTVPQLKQIISRLDQHFDSTLFYQSHALNSQLKVADKEYALDAIENPHEHITYAIASASVAHSYFTLVQQQCEEAQQLINYITNLIINDSPNTIHTPPPTMNPINFSHIFANTVIPDRDQISTEIAQSQIRLRLSHDPMLILHNQVG